MRDRGHGARGCGDHAPGLPEFTALFGRWHIAGLSVEKVLVKPAAESPLAQGAPLPPDSTLPYDAMLWVILRRP